MSGPREGSREIDEGIIVAEAMDWCNSPTEPVPYRIWAKQIQATNLADSVRQTGDRSHVKGSIVLASYGDEPGVGGGVISGTRGAECTPKTWSETVFAEGRNMVRHDDSWWMNHFNTWGRLIYIKDTNSYSSQDAKTIDPDMVMALDQTKGVAIGESPASVDLDRGLPESGIAPPKPTITPGGMLSNPGGPGFMEPMAQLDRWLKENVYEPDEWWSKGFLVKKRPPRPIDPAEPQVPQSEVVRTTKDNRKECKLERYGSNTCVPGVEQSHHIVADVSMNVDGKVLLSKNDGLAICLKGNAAPKGSPNGHSVAQTVYNAETQRAASSPGNNGTLSLEKAEYWGAQAAYRGARADDPNTACTPEYIQGEVRKYHESKKLSADTKVKPGTWN